MPLATELTPQLTPIGGARGSSFAPHRGPQGFFNPWGAPSGRSVADLLRWRLDTNPFAAQKKQTPSLPVSPNPAAGFAALPGPARVMWLGHASLLVEMDGLNLLIDPVFGRAGPVARLAPSPLPVEELPTIHAVLLSHGHRDHMDSGSLSVVQRRFPEALFLTPLGLGASLPRRARYLELDWWQHVVLSQDGRAVRLHLVPAQHWHQRGVMDRNQALWGGWVVQGSKTLYHSGDTGFFEGFADIGQVFGGLDLAVLPLGAYEPRWFMGEQHMPPEGSVRAWELLRARHMLGMHWGTFDLTDEPADHGVRELLPQILADKGHDPRAFVTVQHGGSVAWEGESLVVSGVLD